VVLYSGTEFRKSDGDASVADVVVTGGASPGSFRVVGVEPWGAHGYFKVLGAEIIP
jgi:hypothetical protein